MPKPIITPLQALALFKDNPEGEHFTEDAKHRITLDGPQMSPVEAWAPVAEEPHGALWFCTGEPGDPITDATEWVEFT